MCTLTGDGTSCLTKLDTIGGARYLTGEWCSTTFTSTGNRLNARFESRPEPTFIPFELPLSFIESFFKDSLPGLASI